MSFTRREFLNLAALGIATGALTLTPPSHAATTSKLKALAFDGFPILDPRPVFALAEELFPGRGVELSNAWRIRQFEYQWLRALSVNYADFWQVTEESLLFAAESLKLDLTADKQKRLMGEYLKLKSWPDAPDALKSLKSAGLRLAFLSNLTPAILDAAIKNNGFEALFEHALSTDKLKTYKPDPRAYQMGVDAFGLKKEEILFVAFGGWDAAGAKSFGYPTFWVNRFKQPTERLGVMPDGIGESMNDLLEFVKTRK